MIKRFVAGVALGTTLFLGVPGQVLSVEPKAYDELSDLQRDIFKTKAMVQADPQFAGAIFYEEFDETVRQSEPEQNDRFYHVFAECASGQLVNYYQDLSVMEVMYWTDDEIRVHIGNHSFDMGAMCAYEAWLDKNNTRRL